MRVGVGRERSEHRIPLYVNHFHFRCRAAGHQGRDGHEVHVLSAVAVPRSNPLFDNLVAAMADLHPAVAMDARQA